MPILESLIGPIAAIIDKVIPDKDARDRAKLELLKLQGSQELERIQQESSSVDQDIIEAHDRVAKNEAKLATKAVLPAAA